MADGIIMAAAPSGGLPFQAVRLKMAKRPRKARQPGPNTHRPLKCLSKSLGPLNHFPQPGWGHCKGRWV